MSMGVIDGTIASKVIEEALRMYWRILLGHIDELENPYRMGTIQLPRRPDMQRVSRAIDTIKQELYGLQPGQSFNMEDPKAPPNAKLAYIIMKSVQDKMVAKERRMIIVPKVSRKDGIKERIMALRTLNGMTRAAFGTEVGADKDTVKGWESGRYLPSEKYRVAMIKVFGLPDNYLDSDTKEEKTPDKLEPWGKIEGKSFKAESKIKRALRLLDMLDLSPTNPEVIHALRLASSMVGSSENRAIFEEYCLMGLPGDVLISKYNKLPERLSAILTSQAKRIRRNPKAMAIIKKLREKIISRPDTIEEVGNVGWGNTEPEAVTGGKEEGCEIAGERSTRADTKIKRVLATLGIDGLSPKDPGVLNTLLKASEMVGSSQTRMLFNDYCVSGISGKELTKKHGVSQQMLSSVLTQHAKSIRNNPTAMNLLRSLAKPLKSEIGIFLLDAGYDISEAGRMIKVLTEFNVNTIEELLQAASAGDIDVIPGVGKEVTAKLTARQLIPSDTSVQL